ncbi:hypothetical protein ABIB25_004332 [Nakamurella sp. UYEF19]|uniref:hypothetical protein n=1 Tax=Nakamurella sp. UYEF19 TaxID=1756392 RepID=UPI00339975B4
MDRRIAGVLLLVVALVATLAVPDVVGRSLAGAPSPEQIAAPPAVGSCVGAITGSGPARTGADARPSVTGSQPVATVVPCTGRVMGEIISVTVANPRQVVTLQEYDEVHPSCRSQVETYLGTTATTTLSGVQWSRSIYVDVATVGPDGHDRAAGRTWTACVMTAVDQTYPVTASLKSSWTTRSLPDAYGLCWFDDVVQLGEPVACTSPHRTQQLGYGLVSSPTDSGTSIVSAVGYDAILAGCRTLAASVMDAADPTRGGSLDVRVVVSRSGAPYVQCAVSATGSKKLTGSVIGLGTKPVPLG